MRGEIVENVNNVTYLERNFTSKDTYTEVLKTLSKSEKFVEIIICFVISNIFLKYYG